MHVPAKFWENTAMRFWVTVRKLNVTDRRTDRRTGGVAISPVPGPTAPAGDKNYTAHPHDMVYVPAKFRENTAMRFWVTVRKLNRTDRRTDRQTDGVSISPVPGLRSGWEIQIENLDLYWSTNFPTCGCSTFYVTPLRQRLDTFLFDHVITKWCD